MTVAQNPTASAVAQQGIAATGKEQPAGEASPAAGGDIVSPQEEALRKQNIRAMFVFQFLNAVAWGAALGPVFDRYLYYLGGGAARGPPLLPHMARNSLVGMTESISGLSSLFMAVPVGLLIDRHPDRRARVLRLSVIIGFIATAVAILAVVTDVLVVLYVSLVLLGAFSELSSSASEAIFADSIPQGHRSGVFVTKAIISTVGIAVGPMLSAGGLWVIGDEWQPYQMKAVVVAGALLMPVSCVALMFFRDPQRQQQQSQEQQAPQPEERVQAPAGEDASAASLRTGRRFGPLKPKHVPFILALSNFTTCVGAGMTVKFFNLFFIEDQHFTPIQICVLQTAYPMVIAVFMKWTQCLAKPFGRPQASLTFFSTSVLCLFLLSELQSLPLLLAVFLIRGGFANSTYPLDRSILMDFTPSEQRGRWNAVESLTSMTWSGSALIGGLLSDQRDYRFTFLITAFVYAAACVIYAPLLALVPRKEGDAAAAAPATTADRPEEASAPEGSQAAREVPLLS